ncbi:MAG TPA: transcription termination/antitermination NusG family protein [Candidatus Cloacimonas sp.]|nr:transcription termination/antitermination NusG family protein [Candidatus Cloacimonas sp.]
MATHKPVHVDELFGELKLYEDDFVWTVVHTKPKCEKKLAEYARMNNVRYYLPQFTATRIYQRRKVSFDTVMFPSYIFLVLDHTAKQKIQISGFTTSFIKVRSQAELIQELRAIHGTMEQDVEVKPGIWLSKGLEVEITDGPLKGMHGVVEDHDKLEEVRLQVNILRQAVIVKVDARQVKILSEFEIVE